MIFELLFNFVLIIISVVCFANITKMAPEPIQGNMDAAQWPQIIFGLLIVCLIANMIKIVKNTPKEERNLGPLKNITLSGIFKSKLLWIFVLLFAVVPGFKYIGFIPTSLIFCPCVMLLFGERKPLRILLPTVLIVVVVYVLFINLNIMLPRGTGFLRNFHVSCERLVRIR